MEKLASQRVVLSSPLSFSGSAQRIWKITDDDMSPAIKWLIAVPLALLAIVTVWSFVLCWYLVFGIFLIPYRLVRRSQRKAQKLELQHREALAAIQQTKA